MADSPKESCLSCVFYFNATDGNGYCRRYPPTVLQRDGEVSLSVPVSGWEWCGEYRKKTEKGV